jgi:anaerobic ribonucleoside-triphosphate reductase activating protein
MSKKNYSNSPSTSCLNIAAICPATQALGPGLRAVLWVQGCPIHCKGCIAPDWAEERTAKLMTIEEVLAKMLENPSITGLTLSGGEPMLQARSLANLCRAVRRQKEPDFNILCFTGYSLRQLQQKPLESGCKELLDEIDTLIAGPFQQQRQVNAGLLGSRNKKVIHLTQRLKEYDFIHSSRKVELHILDGEVLVVGIPGEQTLTQLKQIESALYHVRI